MKPALLNGHNPYQQVKARLDSIDYYVELDLEGGIKTLPNSRTRCHLGSKYNCKPHYPSCVTIDNKDEMVYPEEEETKDLSVATRNTTPISMKGLRTYINKMENYNFLKTSEPSLKNDGSVKQFTIPRIMKISQMFSIKVSYLKGIIKNNFGDVFEGQIKNSVASGPGELKMANGYVYRGWFVQDLRDGECVETIGDGVELHCRYQNGLRQGPFTTKMKDGSQFRGVYNRGIQEDKGWLTTKDGSVYAGEFIQGKLNGYGTVKFVDGRFFEGNFKNNQMNGEGKLSFPDGKIIKGNWKDSKLVGQFSVTQLNRQNKSTFGITEKGVVVSTVLKSKPKRFLSGGRT